MYLNHPGYVSPFAYILYKEIPVENWNDKPTVSLNTIGDFQKLFPGTIRIKSELYHGKNFIATAGKSDRFRVFNTLDYGGLNDAVYRISYRGRTGSRLLDNIMLYRNVPLIGNPDTYTMRWEDHQTAQWIGGNLNSFIAGAADMLDRQIDDMLEKLPLPEYNYFEMTDYYLKNVVLSDGNYYSETGQPVAINDLHFTQGDLIITRDLVAMFYKDNAPENYLNSTDLILECNDNSLKIGSISEIIGDTLSLIRWKHRWPTY